MKSNRPITILFDANPMAIAGKSGVGYFTTRLVAALAAEYPDDLRLIGHYYDFLGRKKNVDLVQAPNISYRRTVLLPGKIFNGLRRYMGIQVPLELLGRTRADVLLFPNFAISPSLFRARRAVVIHDLYFTKQPEHINANNLDFLQKFVPPSVQKSDLVITISAFTKEAIVSTYHIPADKILTISIPAPAAVPVSDTQLKAILGGLKITKNYILFVGNIEPRKNLVALVTAYMQLPERLRKQYSLVLAGGKGWNDAEIVRAIKTAQDQGHDILTTGYVTDEQKAALYQNAAMLVLPSHYEGFGMQILEAMNYGVPAAVSNIPVFHEVAGDAALYFDQNNPKAIAETIEVVLTDTKLRDELKKKAAKNLQHYNWNTVAQNVFAKLKEIANG